MEKITVKLPNMDGQEIISQGECYFELLPDRIVQFFEYRANQWVDVHDETLGLEEKDNSSRLVFKKSDIVGVEINYHPKNNLYQLAIPINGSPNDPFFWFRSRQRALDVQRQIEDWLFNK